MLRSKVSRSNREKEVSSPEYSVENAGKKEDGASGQLICHC